MAVCLLDINVLIGRLDTEHEHHEVVTRWWHQNNMSGWATCPITENGFIRILGRPSYPGWPGTPERAALALQKLIEAIPGHQFLPDDFSLLTDFKTQSLHGIYSTELTDLYLLALAVRHKAKFVTLDTKIKHQLVPGAGASYTVLK